MKLQILSDQHLEFGKNLHYFMHRCVPRADTLVIAGDFMPHGGPERYSFINKMILPKWKNTLIIPGNHEFYGSTSDDEWFESKKVVYTHRNGNQCHYFNNDTVEIDGITFVGTTLWSHVGYDKSFQIQRAMNDYRQISGNTVDKNNQRFADNCKFLEDTVSVLDKKCIVMTHHMPSFHVITDRYRGNSLNEAFAADMDVFLMKYGHKISTWIHGHSHDSYDDYINGVRIVRNPMGYPHERDCDMDLVITV